MDSNLLEEAKEIVKEQIYEWMNAIENVSMIFNEEYKKANHLTSLE